MNDPTKVQLELVAFIASHIKRNEMPPTRREIMEHFGWTSANAVGYQLERLSAQGLVTVLPRTSRGLRLTSKARTYLEAA